MSNMTMDQTENKKVFIL